MVLGASPNDVAQPQKILLRVLSWQCTSSPITISQSIGAPAVCDALLKAEPGSYRALYQLGRMAALTGQQLERGAAALRQAVTLTPGEGDPARQHTYNRLGQILEAMGDVAGARAAYESALALDPKLEEAKVGQAPA